MKQALYFTWQESMLNRCAAYRIASRAFVLLLMALQAGTVCFAQTTSRHSSNTQIAFDRRAEANLQTAKKNPLQLYRFLLGMPKGGDLHNHLSGAVYAES